MTFLRRGSVPDRSWRETPFLAVDFETSGLDLRRAKPLSVGWVPIEGGRARLRGAGYSLIRHNGEVGPLEVHRLLPADLASAPSPEEVSVVLAEALAGRVLIAHAATIERTMLRRLGVTVEAIVDTAHLAAALHRREHRHGQGRTLPAVAKALGVPASRPHHAFGDALTTAAAFLALATRLERLGEGSEADLRRLGRARLLALFTEG